MPECLRFRNRLQPSNSRQFQGPRKIEALPGFCPKILITLSVVAGQRHRYNQIHGGPIPTIRLSAMTDEQTTFVVQRYLDELAGVTGDTPAEPLIRSLIERSINRLHLLCSTLLQRSYPRLTRPPLNLQPDEMLSAVVDRLLKALREVR